jgi:hypothetical protein
MKIFKQIFLGLCLVIASLFIFSELSGHKAYAIALADFKDPPATYSLVESTITAKLGNGASVNFVRSNLVSTPLVYTPASAIFNGGKFCAGSKITQVSKVSPTAQIDVTWVNIATDTCSIVSEHNYSGTITLEVNGVAGGTNNDGNACEANSNIGNEWIACPILEQIDDFMNKVNNQIEGQLNFNVQQNLIQPKGIKQAWSSFRVIASALIVLVMLIMVFSQAISAGPFDAYTVRKLLPRLIAAVILIQISWVLSIWLVRFANDIGHGIASLIAAPFGGTDQLSFDNLVGQLGAGAPGTLIAGGFLAGAAAVLINPFGALMLAFIVLISIITALAVLLVRQALIIACIILLPLALVAWILPGTQKYFRLLFDNFIRALLLFPIIVGIIYLGRVFAWVVGTGGSDPGIIDFFAIVIGFFGVYFLLPRAFRWGGSIMSAAASGITSGVNRLGGEQGKKFLQSRKEMLDAERLRQSTNRVASGTGLNKKRPWRYPYDKLKSGRWDPTLGGRNSYIREKKVSAYIAAGEEQEDKDIESSRARIVRLGQDIRARGGNWDLYFQKYADGVESYIDPSLIKKDDAGNTIDDGKVTIAPRTEIDKVAARKQTAILGSTTNWRYHQQYYDENFEETNPEYKNKTEEQRVQARKFFDDNVSTIMPKMPQFYQGYAATAETSPSNIAGLHGVAVESVLAKFSKDIHTATTAESRAAAEGSLLTFLQNFNSAADNPNISLDTSALKAVKAFLDKGGGTEFRKDINIPEYNKGEFKGRPTPDGRGIRGIPIIEPYVDLPLDAPIKTQIDSISRSLAPKIDNETGTLSRGGRSQAPRREAEAITDSQTAQQTQSTAAAAPTQEGTRGTGEARPASGTPQGGGGGVSPGEIFSPEAVTEAVARGVALGNERSAQRGVFKPTSGANTGELRIIRPENQPPPEQNDDNNTPEAQ